MPYHQESCFVQFTDCVKQKSCTPARSYARTVLESARRLFLALGLAALGYCVLLACAASFFQVLGNRQLAKVNAAVSGSPTAAGHPIALGEPLHAGPGMILVGQLNIPRLNLSAVVAEGATASVLKVAVGHVPGTALPAQSGNVALVAHRDTFFRGLGELKPGDLVYVIMAGAEYSYRVTFTDVVAPEETWVLQPATGDTLTLITCYPFHYIGPAPKRFVVRARRVNEIRNANAHPNKNAGCYLAAGTERFQLLSDHLIEN